MPLYLALGCLLLAAFLFFIKKRPHQGDGEPRKTALSPKSKRWIFILIIATILVMLSLRFGQWHVASLVAASAILWPIIRAFIIGFIGKKMADAGRTHAQKRASTMNATEAYDILGLESGASEADIERAYKKLMQKNHPDQGGNEYFAKKLNEARSILLKS